MSSGEQSGVHHHIARLRSAMFFGEQGGVHHHIALLQSAMSLVSRAECTTTRAPSERNVYSAEFTTTRAPSERNVYSAEFTTTSRSFRAQCSLVSREV